MFFVIGQFGLYLDPTGLAAARIDVLAFKVVMIPALATETVCCSYFRISEDRTNELPKAWTHHNFV
jgi:hypothetical protein